MGEAIILFIFISWLLVTLIIYWVKHNVELKDSNIDKIIKEFEDELKGRGD